MSATGILAAILGILASGFVTAFVWLFRKNTAANKRIAELEEALKATTTKLRIANEEINRLSDRSAPDLVSRLLDGKG